MVLGTLVYIAIIIVVIIVIVLLLKFLFGVLFVGPVAIENFIGPQAFHAFDNPPAMFPQSFPVGASNSQVTQVRRL